MHIVYLFGLVWLGVVQYISVKLYMFYLLKLTLSACVWRWSCTRYTRADVVDAGGSGEA